jgi:hypothetical protein
MAPVEIPLLINIIVAIGICILTIAVVYFTLIVGNKQLDLGEKEQVVLYGKETKPIYGKY